MPRHVLGRRGRSSGAARSPGATMKVILFIVFILVVIYLAQMLLRKR